MLMWPSASRRFRLRDSVDFSMSSSCPISTAVMASRAASCASSVYWLAVMPERTHGVVVNARDDARKLAHARCKACARRRLGDVGDTRGLSRFTLQRVGHQVHVGPRIRSWSYNPLALDAAILSQGSNGSATRLVRANQAGQQYGRAGQGGDAFAAPDEAQAFRRRRLHADARGVDAEDAGDAIRAWPRGAGRSSGLRTGTSRRRWQCARRACARARPRPRGRCARARRATSHRSAGKCWPMSPSPMAPRMRVGERVQRDVGVRVALEAVRVGDLHPAQPHVIARREGDARQSRCRCAARAGARRAPADARPARCRRRSSASCCCRCWRRA